MKKIILSLVIVVILALAGVLYYLFSNLDNLIKEAIEKYGSEATQTAVLVESVHIQLKDGAAAINGLSVANPEGFSYDTAFSLGEIKTGIDLKSLKEEPYIIDEITVRAPQVFVEINKDNKTNLNELKNNLMASIPVVNPADQDKQTDKTTTAEPRLIIRRISFTDGNIKALVVPLNNKEYTLKLPSINMRNLGGTTGSTPTELTKEIINQLIDTAKKEVKKKGINAELDKLKAKARTKLETKKTELKSKIEEKKLKAIDKLKGLFGK